MNFWFYHPCILYKKERKKIKKKNKKTYRPGLDSPLARRDQILINYYQQADHERKQKNNNTEADTFKSVPQHRSKNGHGLPWPKKKKKSVEPSPQSQFQIYFLLSSPNLSSPERFSKKEKDTMPFTLLGSGRVVEQQLCQCKKKKKIPLACTHFTDTQSSSKSSQLSQAPIRRRKKKKTSPPGLFFLVVGISWSGPCKVIENLGHACARIGRRGRGPATRRGLVNLDSF